jgi:nitric-oxide synthase
VGTPGYRDEPPRAWDPAAPVDPAEAEEFLRTLHDELPALGPVRPRLDQVRREIDESGTYTHTSDELAYGARIAWRNASRCIGRLYWRSLAVRDLRAVRTPEGVFTELVRHLEFAAGHRGDAPETRRIRPVISVFAPAHPDREPDVRLWNEQLIRYAGYRDADGSVVGDPRYTRFTEAVTALGWRGKGERFDVLPLVIDSPVGGPRLFDLPEYAIVEVPLAHPEYSWFAELGLRWHAVPAISNMRLSIGGVSYPLAPFNGWYLGTEIGARNLADPDRYDQLPVVAARLGLDTSSEATLWRDRALVELNRAVLWSFERAGLRISDHHTESRRFLDHVAKEERAGRPTPADWSWIVPPMSGSATPVFHRYYHEADLRPNFYLDAEAADLGLHGGYAGCPVH